MKDLLRYVAERVAAYIEGVQNRVVALSAEGLSRLRTLAESWAGRGQVDEKRPSRRSVVYATVRIRGDG